MKNNEVKVGGTYLAKVSDRVVTVRIDSVHSRRGWNATNTRTGKRIHIKTAQRLRGEASKTTKSKKPQAAEEAVAGDQKTKTPVKVAAKKAKPKRTDGKHKPKRVSALDAGPRN